MLLVLLNNTQTCGQLHRGADDERPLFRSHMPIPSAQLIPCELRRLKMSIDRYHQHALHLERLFPRLSEIENNDKKLPPFTKHQPLRP